VDLDAVAFKIFAWDSGGFGGAAHWGNLVLKASQPSFPRVLSNQFPDRLLIEAKGPVAQATGLDFSRNQMVEGNKSLG
jgi:hypothetical protein